MHFSIFFATINIVEEEIVMENERKGNGIFLGVVGVATLIVAIIGASFAYFSIQASSEEGAVNLTAYEFNASLSMSQVYGPGDKGLIPVNPMGNVPGASAPDNTNLAYALNVAQKCTDNGGFGVCALYEVTVSNDSDAPLVLNGVIKTLANTAAGASSEPFSHLQFRTATKSGNAYTIESTGHDIIVAGNDEVSLGSAITVPAKSGTTPGTYTMYVVVYLNDTGDDQSAEMGATYSGQLIFTSSGTANQLTGTFGL